MQILSKTLQSVKLVSIVQADGGLNTYFPFGDVQASYYTLKPNLKAEMFPFVFRC